MNSISRLRKFCLQSQESEDIPGPLTYDFIVPLLFIYYLFI